MANHRIPWEQYFMMQALVISQRSTCNRALVGCVLVKDKRIIGTGYNGSVTGQAHCDDVGHQMVDGHCVRTIHSEMNTLIQCAKNGVSTLNTEVYVTHFPCYNCTKALVQAGVKRINYFFDYRDDPLALDLLNKTGVTVKQVKIDPAYVHNLASEIDEYEANH